MTTMNKNENLMERLNAQFAEELGFANSVRVVTNYLMDAIGMNGQCAVSPNGMMEFYQLIADETKKLYVEDVELVLDYFTKDGYIDMEKTANVWILTLTDKMQELEKELQEGGESYREVSSTV